jgi:hypothetical protein
MGGQQAETEVRLLVCLSECQLAMSACGRGGPEDDEAAAAKAAALAAVAAAESSTADVGLAWRQLSRPVPPSPRPMACH